MNAENGTIQQAGVRKDIAGFEAIAVGETGSDTAPNIDITAERNGFGKRRSKGEDEFEKTRVNSNHTYQL